MDFSTKSLDEASEIASFSQILSHIPQNPAFSLSKPFFSRINAALTESTTPIQQIYCIALIYLVNFSQFPTNTSQITPEIASHLYILLEKLPGSLISAQVFQHLAGFLRTNLCENASNSQDSLEILMSLEDQVLGVSKELVFPNEFLEEIELKVELFNSFLQKDKPLAFLEFLNFLSEAQSLHDQALILKRFSKSFFEKVLKPKKIQAFFQESPGFGTSNPAELFRSVHKFLDSAVFQHRYAVLLPKEQKFEEFAVVLITQQANNLAKNEDFSKLSANSELKIASFVDIQARALLKTLPLYECFEPLLDFLLKNLVLSKEIFSQEMKLEFIKFLISLILDRLWDVYPQYHHDLKSKLQAIFKEIDRENLHICQIQAAFFFYEKIKTRNRDFNGFLKDLLAENPQIKSLVDSFSKDSHLYYRGPGQISELFLKDHCPLNQTIAAGSSFKRIIEVFIANSLIYWVFATRTLDIDFKAEFLGSFDVFQEKAEKLPLVLLQQKKLDTGKRVHRGVIYAKKPGIYRFTWDNSYSWFTEKLLRYRVFLLEPETQSFNENTEKNQENCSPFAIFNSCRDLLGLAPRKSQENGFLEYKRKKNAKIKETLDNLYKWKGVFRVIIAIRPKSFEIKALYQEKSFELQREVEEFSQHLLKEALLEVLQKVSTRECKENPEILVLNSRNREEITEIPGFSCVNLEFTRVFMHCFMRKFVERGGDIGNISRKPLPFSKILIMSMLGNALHLAVFSDLSRNLADCLQFSAGNLAKNSQKLLMNCLLFLKFRPKKIIINPNGVFPEDYTAEQLKHDLKELFAETSTINEEEDEILPEDLSIEFFNFDFNFETLLK